MSGQGDQRTVQGKRKAMPDATRPGEVMRYYAAQLRLLLSVWYRDSIRAGPRRDRFSELARIAGSGRGRPAFVLANGPSVKKLDPSKIERLRVKLQADLFCVKFYVNTEFARVAKPDYWVVSDPGEFDLKRAEVCAAFANAQTLVAKGVFAPIAYAALVAKQVALPVFGYNDTETSHIFSNSIDPRYPRSYMSMTAYKALAIAIFAEYFPIYICGFDNSFIQNFRVNANNEIYRSTVHFEPTARQEPNATLYSARGVADEFLSLSRLFIDLRKFQHHDIRNLDADSLTDAFPKDCSLDVFRERPDAGKTSPADTAR
jgi:hypothetical protein